ncbi:MAG: DUF2169 domain-containing protein [Polyangiaceae bacterium]|nr:DUF2169 domain-containing protein [Polyangiaceae bacterium]
MFVRNTTQWQVVLARGLVSPEQSVLSLNLDVALMLHARGVEALPASAPSKTDPPDIRKRSRWAGVSVTAAGHAPCPTRPPYASSVSLRVGVFEHRLAVLGPRVWSRNVGGALVATEPAKFDTLSLDWRHAFGGTQSFSPGLFPGTELPWPGGVLGFPLNPSGTGWYASEQLAVGQPLPRIESPAAMVRVWSDAPTPAGVSPCPDLIALRLQGWVARRGVPAAVRPALESLHASEPHVRAVALCAQHHASGVLILPDVAPGTLVRLEGLAGAPLELRVPASPVVVTARRGRDRVLLSGLLRSLHVDADRRAVRLSYGHFLEHATAATRAWLETQRRGG